MNFLSQRFDSDLLSKVDMKEGPSFKLSIGALIWNNTYAVNHGVAAQAHDIFLRRDVPNGIDSV